MTDLIFKLHKMFSAHKVWSNDISIRNMILLFLTILFGFVSVITLAQISIPSTIDNARQTIGRITITSDGTDSGKKLRDFNYDGNGKVFVDRSGLPTTPSFAWKVLGIDSKWDLVYINSTGLVVSWGTAWGSADDDWTVVDSVVGTVMYAQPAGNVGIGTTTMNGKLHVRSTGQTELYLEDSSAWSAANINLKNTVNNWMLGWFSDRFYIGNNSVAFLNVTTWGNVGIGTIDPKANLQVVGNIIGGDYNNSSTWILGFIWWWFGNHINWDYNTIVWWYNNNINIAHKSFIGWWIANQITWSWYSVIPWWFNNLISSADDSFAWWINAQALNNNTFVRNSEDTIWFQSNHAKTFIVNAPGGVGIQTNNPFAGTLTVSGNVVLDPQPFQTNICTIKWAVYYYNGWSSAPGGYLCYCDWAYWRQVQNNAAYCIAS